jgi:hypothetical protein
VLGVEDRDTIATYSVMVYFTPDFKALHPDVMGYVSEAISETNEGYANSGIPLRVELHCVEELENFVETPASSSLTLSNFAVAKGKSNYCLEKN